VTSADTRTIEAAGGAVWRPNKAGDDIELALIHRPKYDDWSLPKGKLKPGEHPLVGAMREVEEETGLTCVVGRALGEVHYEKAGTPKRVRYWALQYDSGTFTPNDEVDALEWLTPDAARERLLPERDREILDELMRGPVATFPVLVVRHGSAGERGSFDGPDRKRPLDDKGRRQASGLAVLLDLFGVETLVAADVVRCVDTLAPFSTGHGVEIATEPAFSERGFADDPDRSTDRLVELAARALPTAVCSQGRTIPGLLTELCETLGVEPPEDLTVRKGALWVLHFDDEVDELELVDLERIDALV
jgi:8-oxo-dGTP diphosphatase